jgi:hypothetical protein
MGYIYMTTNLVNGKRYIGQCNRNRSSHSYIGSGKALRLAIEKYGKENFKKEYLEFSDDQDELNRLEKEYIERFNAIESPEFYNMMEGGQGGATTTGMQLWSDEMKEYFRKKNSENPTNKISLRCYNNTEELIFKTKKQAWRAFKEKGYPYGYDKFCYEIRNLSDSSLFYTYYVEELKC